MLVLACTWWFDGRPWLADGFQRFYPSPIMKVHESTISASPYLFHVQSCTYPHALGSLPARPYDVHSRSEPQITAFGFQIETNRLLLDWCTLAVFSRYIGILSLVQLSRAEPTDSLMAKERLLAYCFCKGGWEIPENLTLISVNPC